MGLGDGNTAAKPPQPPSPTVQGKTLDVPGAHDDCIISVLSPPPSQKTVVRRFPFSRLRDPTAFISREQQQSSRARKSGFTRVVVVREDGAGHGQGRGGSSPVFHAFQCLDNNPDDLVQVNKLYKIHRCNVMFMMIIGLCSFSQFFFAVLTTSKPISSPEH